jgi:hypothetical protein
MTHAANEQIGATAVGPYDYLTSRKLREDIREYTEMVSVTRQMGALIALERCERRLKVLNTLNALATQIKSVLDGTLTAKGRDILLKQVEKWKTADPRSRRPNPKKFENVGVPKTFWPLFGDNIYTAHETLSVTKVSFCRFLADIIRLVEVREDGAAAQ